MNKKIIFSILIGIIDFFLLLLGISTYETLRFSKFIPINRFLDFFANLHFISSILAGIVFSVLAFSYLPVFFLSLFGIFLAIKSLSSQRSFAIFAIFLNSLNLFLSLFIAWLLFGLARGM